LTRGSPANQNFVLGIEMPNPDQGTYALDENNAESQDIFIPDSKRGISVFCNFTQVDSAQIAVYLGNVKGEYTEAKLSEEITTAGVHGLDVKTFAQYAKIVVIPAQGTSFTCAASFNIK
jgi:hypothetical protein